MTTARAACKRILDLLEPGDLRLGQVVINRVAVVKLGVNNGSGDGGGGFGITCSHGSASVVKTTVKVNGKGGNLTPAPQKLLNRWSQNWCGLLRQSYLPLCKILSKSVKGFLRMRDFAALGTK